MFYISEPEPFYFYLRKELNYDFYFDHSIFFLHKHHYHISCFYPAETRIAGNAGGQTQAQRKRDEKNAE